MNTMQVICSSCAGTGRLEIWKLASTDEDTGIGTMKKEETMCECCKGKGYTEYAIFSVEEAEIILKHCGLSTKN